MTPPGPGAPAGAPRPPSGRAARNVGAAVAVVVLVLVAVLVGLLRAPGWGSASASGSPRPDAGTSSSASSSATAGATGRTTTPTGGRDAETGLRLVALADLPREARQTVALIDAGGPFPYSQDGVTFGNNERRLPAHPRGWYREYTVRTPGERDRGPRRIVTGDDDRQVFYTADHYGSFVRVAR